jgi:hypothetical protein
LFISRNSFSIHSSTRVLGYQIFRPTLTKLGPLRWQRHVAKVAGDRSRFCPSSSGDSKFDLKLNPGSAICGFKFICSICPVCLGLLFLTALYRLNLTSLRECFNLNRHSDLLQTIDKLSQRPVPSKKVFAIQSCLDL